MHVVSVRVVVVVEVRECVVMTEDALFEKVLEVVVVPVQLVLSRVLLGELLHGKVHQMRRRVLRKDVKGRILEDVLVEQRIREQQNAWFVKHMVGKNVILHERGVVERRIMKGGGCEMFI